MRVNCNVEKDVKHHIFFFCRPIQDLAVCTGEKTRTACDLSELKTELFINLQEDVLEDLKQYGGAVKISEVVGQYKFADCAGKNIFMHRMLVNYYHFLDKLNR